MEPILEKTLTNDLNVKITDHSRLIAADRWYIKIVCEVSLTLGGDHFADCREDDPELFGLIRHRIGDVIRMELVQERNFVDTAVKEDIVRELLTRISENMTGYLSSESFPGRLFDMRYDEARKACLVDLARGDDNYEAGDDEPADFSACFRD